MKTPVRRRDGIASLLLVLFLLSPILQAEEPPQIPAPGEIKAQEWDLVKDRAEYSAISDPLFSELEELSKTDPMQHPINGGPGGGADDFAWITVKPKTASSDGTTRSFTVLLAYNHQGYAHDGKDLGVVLDRLYLTGDVREISTTWTKQYGTYVSPPVLEKLVTLVLRKSHGIRKPAVEKSADGRWQVEKTAVLAAWNKDQPQLFGEVQALMESGKKQAAPRRGRPWAWVQIYPEKFPESGGLFYRVGIYKDGGMSIIDTNEWPIESVSRERGWFESPELWEKLRLLAVRKSEELRNKEKKEIGPAAPHPAP